MQLKTEVREASVRRLLSVWVTNVPGREKSSGSVREASVPGAEWGRADW